MMYLFFLKLTVAEAMFACNLKRRNKFIIRILIGIAATFLIQFLYDLLLGAIFGDNLPKALYISLFVLLLVTTTIVIFLSFDCSLIKAMACSTGGYAVQNCIYYIVFILVSISNFTFNVSDSEFLNGFVEFLFYLAFYIPFFFWIWFATKNHGIGNGLGLPSVIISVLIVLTTIVLSSYVPWGEEYVALYIYSVICSVLIVGIQLGLFEMSALKRQMETIEQLDHAKWEQYKLFNESIEQINIKSHDLKQQINLLLSGSPEIRNQMLEETLKAVGTFDSMTRTGNEALDVVLTEKHLICEKNNIKCSCIVDGKALEFMSAMDISSLFGNAFDNAIEGVRRYEDEEKRFINLNVSRQGNLLIIHIENYFEGTLNFSNGLPETTKENKAHHGFGMKSIKLIVEKYRGNLLVNAEDNLFTVDILFMCPQ